MIAECAGLGQWEMKPKGCVSHKVHACVCVSVRMSVRVRVHEFACVCTRDGEKAALAEGFERYTPQDGRRLPV